MELTQERLKELIDYDIKTGVITRKQPTRRGDKIGDVAGWIAPQGQCKYIMLGVDGKRYFAHRIAWLYVHGVMPKDQIDHIDGDGSNNAIHNLRDVTYKENTKNLRMNKRNKSGVNGVSWVSAKGMWRADISVDKKKMNLGYFASKSDAVKARKEADLKHGFHANHGTVRGL